MFLNCLGQPILLIKANTYFSSEELKKAPLLLCHKNALDGKLLPASWSGKVFATHEILHEAKQKEYSPTSTQTLNPNEVFDLNMDVDEECPYKSKNISITAIPWDKEYIIYLIKDDYVTSLLTDMITEDMSVFVQNKILRNSIKSGIDVLYINDGIYKKSTEKEMSPPECLLGALITMVQPRLVKGLLSEEPLPLHIINCCADLSGG